MRISLKYKLFLIFVGFYGFLVGLFYLFPIDPDFIRLLVSDGTYTSLYQGDFMQVVGSTNYGSVEVYFDPIHWMHVPPLLFFAFLSTLIAEINTRKKPFYNVILQKIGAFLGSVASSFGITYLAIIMIFGSGPWGWGGFVVIFYGLIGGGIIFLIARAMIGSWYLRESLSERLVYIPFELSVLIVTVQVLL